MKKNYTLAAKTTLKYYTIRASKRIQKCVPSRECLLKKCTLGCVGGRIRNKKNTSPICDNMHSFRRKRKRGREEMAVVKRRRGEKERRRRGG